MTNDSAKILAVPAEELSGFYGRTNFYSDPAIVHNALEAIRNHGKFYLRKWAEETEIIRQVIPCAIVRNNTKLLCIRRAKKGRKDLRLRHTLLFGGHVDEEDSCDGRDCALYRCVQRELREELGLSMTLSPIPIAVVVDIETASSRRHFGVIFECQIEDDLVSVSKECDNAEFTRSGRNNDYFLTEVGDFAGKKFDPWSQLFLTSHFARQNFAIPQSAFPTQLPLRLMLG